MLGQHKRWLTQKSLLIREMGYNIINYLNEKFYIDNILCRNWKILYIFEENSNKSLRTDRESTDV